MERLDGGAAPDFASICARNSGCPVHIYKDVEKNLHKCVAIPINLVGVSSGYLPLTNLIDATSEHSTNQNAQRCSELLISVHSRLALR